MKTYTIDEAKLNKNNFVIEQLDRDTIALCFENIYEINNKFYTISDFDNLNIQNRDKYVLTPYVEYWHDVNKFVYMLLFDDGMVDWNVSDELKEFIQSTILKTI